MGRRATWIRLTGDFEQSIETEKGVVGVLAVRYKDAETLVLDEVTVFGDQFQPIRGVERELRAALPSLLAHARNRGFRKLRVCGERTPNSTSSAPGRKIDILFDVETGKHLILTRERPFLRRVRDWLKWGIWYLD